MRFHSTANRRLIALLFLTVFYLDLFASVERSKINTGYPAYNDHAGTSSTFEPARSADHDKGKQKKSTPGRADGSSRKFIPKSTAKPIDGPGQPEMSTFRPAGLDNMVDLFTGDFSYNIPLIDVGGYPVNLFYNGGITMDQEASWVGLGFNVNPGTVSRNMRGLPDDFSGDEVKKEMNVKPNLTVGVSLQKSTELFGMPKDKKYKVGGKLNLGLFYNNYQGIGLEAGVSPEVSLANWNKTEIIGSDTNVIGSGLTAELNLNLNSQRGLQIRPSVQYFRTEKGMRTSVGAGVNIDSRQGLQSLHMDFSEERLNANPTQRAINNMSRFGSVISFAKPAVMPTVRMPMENINGNLSLTFSKEYMRGFLKGAKTLAGYVSNSYLQKHEKVSKAFGYMHYSDAVDKDALMDFNRINDIPYTDANPVMAFPAYTYDIFSISGEGTGGSFRAYRSDLGYVRDQYVKSKNGSVSLGLGFSTGESSLKVDVNLSPVFSPTVVGPWDKFNAAKNSLPFTNFSEKYEPVYFKNPAEKTIIDPNFYEALGGENMVRLKMQKMIFHAELKPTLEAFDNTSKAFRQDIPINKNTLRLNRDKRSQVITVLTAKEASLAGLSKLIEYYPIGFYPRSDCDNNKRRLLRYEKGEGLRKSHHISEVTVLQGDGKRYVYGIPVYNSVQEDVTFNVAGNTSSNELVAYQNDVDNSADNKRGLDHFYQKETMPGYAHSYLLTGLLSPDYVDVKGDGITEDDHGNAIKFNYTKIFPDVTGLVKWRLPATSSASAPLANKSTGLRTDKSDDKAHYTYGEKELWYLNSIESKTMIATFKISSDRHDGKTALGRTGGVSTQGSYKLDEINLYSKAEYNSNENARPIKTVHFYYDYSLCKGAPGNTDPQEGKLTLKKIWFSYGGNDRRTTKNAYLFAYHNNQPYNRSGADRWGNYKDPQHNPGAMPNEMFPYTSQDPAARGPELAPWQLNKIILPSGGKIDINYEHDDYAYVQNRRAASMFTIEGFSHDKMTINNELYTVSGTLFNDKKYIKIKARTPITPASTPAETNARIRKLYLADITQLYMKLSVKVPKDQFGEGYEPIGFFVDIIGCEADPDPNYFWIKIGEVNVQISQAMDNILQFAKENLPSKIYPGYNTSNQNALAATVKSLLGMATEVVRTVGGFDNVVRLEKKFQKVDLSKSFVRLSQPDLAKRGGGYRVKEVKISDQWNKITGHYEAIYGQTYDYTTKEKVGGEDVEISSGVASYEPAIGSEENPFREVMKTRVKKPLGKDQFLLQELPVGEMFYPSAMVGYSKVRVSSIKKGNVKNPAGIQEVVFFTTRDFPTVSSYTTFDPGSKIKKRPDPFSRIMTHRSSTMDNLSQGLVVSLNDMNGRMKSQATYAENNPNAYMSYTENIYRTEVKSDRRVILNNMVPVVTTSAGQVKESLIGKDVELMTDFREHNSKTYSTSIDFNLEGPQIAPPVLIIFPILLKGSFYDESIYRSSAITKIVNTYGILDSVISIDKGSMVSTKNMLYDGETGEVLLNRTNNEFDHPLYSFSYPAAWAYKGMSGAYKNIGASYEHVDFRAGMIVGGISNPEAAFESGDEILIWRKSIFGVPGNIWPCNITEGTGNNGLLPSTADIVWALHTKKDPLATHGQLIFIDRNGKPFTGADVTIKVIRSGFRNILGASVGSIVTKDNPVKKLGNLRILSYGIGSQVLSSGVQEFKEMWRTDSLFEQKYTLEKFEGTRHYSYYDLPVTQAYTLQYNSIQKKEAGFKQEAAFYTAVNPGFRASLSASKAGNFLLGLLQVKTEKSWIRFNLNNIPAGSFVTNATLTAAFKAPSSTAAAHFSANPRTNRIYLQRIRHPWFNTSNEWKTRYANELLPNEFSVYEPDRLTTNQTLYGPGRRHAFFPVTSMVRHMLTDQQNGSSNAQGFKLSLGDEKFDRTIDKSWVSFKDNSSDCTSGNDFVCTGLNVTCLTCDPGYYVDSALDHKSILRYICTKMDTVRYCESIFNNLRINPYVTGILGNWRPYRSLVYYGDRKETNSALPVDLRAGGVINDYKTWWQFGADSLTSAHNIQTPWVWNSQITQFNLKGAELENKDPLGRYNAGIYGYNDNLPIAVANNARYQEIAYDGFEDYDFTTQQCIQNCKKGRRLVFTNATVDAGKSHSGTRSLKIAPYGSASIEGIIKPNDQSDGHSVRIQMDSTAYNTTRVDGKGTGFKVSYFANNNFTNLSGTEVLPYASVFAGAPLTSMTVSARSIRWEGYVQATVAGIHQFDLSFSAGYVTFKVDGVSQNMGGGNSVYHKLANVLFAQGGIKKIDIEYVFFSGNTNSTSSLALTWRLPGVPANSWIPSNLVYPPGTQGTAASAVITTSFWCVKQNSIKATDNYLIDGFNLIQGRKMFLSAWVKEGSDNCTCSTYVNSSIRVYCNNSPVTPELKASGSIIDGWQRYEGAFTVPATATTFSIVFQNSSSSKDVFFDDVRIQPFNSNMKTFVYHPQNLRLMAEGDENNFTTFYEYDDDGTLVRVKKETERGVKTIKETRSGLQKLPEATLLN